MEWESADDDLQDAKGAMDVLDMLRPWTTVKELSIDGYVGVKFPTWLGHPSFSNMVLLRIESCRKCTSLPAIGQLPSLKNLVIKGMANVQRVGPEFYGEGCLKPFQSLETLCFGDLQEWQDWIPSGVEYEEFPRLREISISYCPKLRGKLPYHLPSLEELTSLTNLIIDCDGGFPDWQSFPSEEEDGKMMMTLPTSLTTLKIYNLPNI
ncbi:putative disease resistance RPP13-like protein 1, partial [Fagus crenata]